MKLIPTIVKDEQGNILMLAYSSKESLKRAIKENKGIYFSRERKKIWIKGETSGNNQKLVDLKIDCDKDALLFIVKQKGNACHYNRYSCFQDENFDLDSLAEIIQSRIKNKNKDSYTYKLYKNSKLLKRKILEEANELVKTKNKKQVIWEASDLLYFMLVFLAKRQVKLKDVEKKLEQRNINKSLKSFLQYQKPKGFWEPENQRFSCRNKTDKSKNKRRKK